MDAMRRGSGGCVCVKTPRVALLRVWKFLLDLMLTGAPGAQGQEQSKRSPGCRQGAEGRVVNREWASECTRYAHTRARAHVRAATVRTYPGLWAAVRCTAKGWMGRV